MDIFKLQIERAELLRANPHLHVLQDRVNDAMQLYRKPEDKMYWLSIEMMDSFDKLREELNKLDKLLKDL